MIDAIKALVEKLAGLITCEFSYVLESKAFQLRNSMEPISLQCCLFGLPVNIKNSDSSVDLKRKTEKNGFEKL